jgi:hypothetical protein
MFSQALSPALLLYRIAHNVKYTPVDKHPGHVQQTASQWLYDTENHIVAMNKSQGRAWHTRSKLTIGSLSKTSIRCVIMVNHKPAACLISCLQPSTTISDGRPPPFD